RVYFGLCSAVGLMAAVFIVFVVGTRDERSVVIMVYAIFAGFHAALAGLVIAGRFDDPGVLTFTGGSALKLFVIEALVQLLLLVTLVAATAIRAGMVGNVRRAA